MREHRTHPRQVGKTAELERYEAVIGKHARRIGRRAAVPLHLLGAGLAPAAVKPSQRRQRRRSW